MTTKTTSTDTSKATLKTPKKSPAKKPTPKTSGGGGSGGQVTVQIVKPTPTGKNCGACYKPGTRINITPDEIKARSWPADCYKILDAE